MKKAIGIITQSCLIADFYRGILEELFDDIAEIFTYSLDNGTLRELKECDLYVRAVTSYDLIHYSWAEPYFPPEERTVYMDLTFSRRAADRVCAYPPGDHCPTGESEPAHGHGEHLPALPHWAKGHPTAALCPRNGNRARGGAGFCPRRGRSGASGYSGGGPWPPGSPLPIPSVRLP